MVRDGRGAERHIVDKDVGVLELERLLEALHVLRISRVAEPVPDDDRHCNHLLGGGRAHAGRQQGCQDDEQLWQIHDDCGGLRPSGGAARDFLARYFNKYYCCLT